jgi:hypothetical protein
MSAEAQRQIAEILAAQQHTAPPAPNGYTVRVQDSNVIDLDAQLAAIDTGPQPVRLNGHTYQVRRNFTAAEARAIMGLAAKGDDSPEDELRLWTALVGAEDAERLRNVTENLPNLHAQRIIAQIWVAAGLGQAGGALGEA